jgi:hypothetical protein
LLFRKLQIFTRDLPKQQTSLLSEMSKETFKSRTLAWQMMISSLGLWADRTPDVYKKQFS